MIKKQSINYNVGIYCRLSKDDRKSDESMSISTQKLIISNFVKENNWKIYNIYIDDGYSGLNFERPAFKALKEDIEKGYVNLVITKDLSRLGRNYLETGALIEIYFPEHNCRYIALTDNVDTLNNTMSDITPFKNLLNEMYSKDISNKIKAAKRARLMQGKFMGATAPYGYKKSPENKNLLIIDNETALIVKKIFNLAKKGLGIAKIRKILTDEKIKRPAYHCFKNNNANFQRFFNGEDDPNCYTWSNNSVRGILRNPVYMGSLAGYKRPVLGMKTKKRLSTLPEDWVVVNNTHEPIIPKEEFEVVQKLITSRRIDSKSGYNNIFSGLIKCADCGYAMSASHAHRNKSDDILKNIVYVCNNYKTYGKEKCTCHSIEAVNVHNAVLQDIRYHAELALKNNKEILKRVMSRINLYSKMESNSLNKELKKAKSRLNEIDKLYMALYEDKANNIVSERNFNFMTNKYENEQAELEIRIKEIQEYFNKEDKVLENAKLFINNIKNYAELIELDSVLLNRLIKRITIGEVYLDENNELKQEICIYYNFVGRID